MTSPRSGRFINVVVEFTIARRRPVFWWLLAWTLLLSAGMARIHVENNFRAFVGSDNTALQTNDWLSRRQGQGLETVVILYRPADGDAFSTISLLQYIQLANRARSLPHAKGVTSWLDLDKLVESKGEPSPSSGLQHAQRKAVPMLFGVDVLAPGGAAMLRRDALASPATAGRYVGRDGRTAAVTVSVELGEGAVSRRARVEDLTAAVAAIEAELRKAVPGDSLSLTGSTLFDHAAFQILRDDLRLLFPLAVVMIASVLYAIYRSVPFTALFMLLTLLPVLATAGLGGLLGVEFSNLSIAGLLLVGTLSVADIMHLANSYFLVLGNGMPREAALRYAFRHNLFAVTATTSTTIMGEATLFFTSPKPVQMMGVIVITGSVIALFLALTMLPHALAIVKPPKSGNLRSLSNGMAAMADFAHRQAAPVLAVFSVVLVVCAIAIPSSHIDDSLQGWFGKRTAFHRDLTLLKSQYLGSDTVVLALEIRPDDMIAASRFPEAAPSTDLYRQLADDLHAVGGPGQWLSMVEVAQARRARLDDGGLSVYGPVDTSVAAKLKPFTADALSRAGLMTRYEPGRSDYSLWYFHSDTSSSFDLVDKERRLHAVMQSHADGRDVRSGGVGVAIAQVSVTNLEQVLVGSLVVFALIVASMVLVFRSALLGAISVVPNLAPVVFSFGLWAYIAGEINMAAVTVLGVAFGIVVDDTIHILTKYRENLQEGHDSRSAFREATRECGVGILATTLVLAGGFALLGTSNFLLTAQRCQLTAITIMSALLFDLMMLPALLSIVGRRFKSTTSPRSGPMPSVSIE